MLSAFIRFLIRWFVCAAGLWVTAVTLGHRIKYSHAHRLRFVISHHHSVYNDHLHVIVIAGLVLAIINLIIRPIVVILSLPAIVITLGLFTVVINGLMVLLASKLYHPLHITNFWAAMLAGMVIGLVNYIVASLWRKNEYKYI